MTRALWKGPFIQNFLLQEVKKLYYNTNYNIIKIKSRNSIIFPIFLGFNFEVYNGKKFISISVKKNMIGAKFGEFILTRKPFKHKIK
jgi:small subunit ribosomal protein S19